MSHCWRRKPESHSSMISLSLVSLMARHLPEEPWRSCLVFSRYDQNCEGERERRELKNNGRRQLTHLVALGAVTAIEYHILASIVQARAIATYFSSLAQHPVLLQGQKGRERVVGREKLHININCSSQGWETHLLHKIFSRVAALLIVTWLCLILN